MAYEAQYSSRFRVEITGAEQLLASLRNMGKAGKAVTRDVLQKKADEVVKVAKPLTPLEPPGGDDPPGALRDSLRRSRVTITQNASIVSVIAGGEALMLRQGLRATTYAVKQHEDLTYRHTEGGPKYLERAVLEVAPSIESALEKALAQAMGAA